MWVGSQVTNRGRGTEMLLEEPLPLETAQESPSFKLEPMETERSPGRRLQELLGPGPKRDPQTVKERALSAPWLSLFPPEGNMEDKELTGPQVMWKFSLSPPSCSCGGGVLLPLRILTTSPHAPPHLLCLSPPHFTCRPNTLLPHERSPWHPWVLPFNL